MGRWAASKADPDIHIPSLYYRHPFLFADILQATRTTDDATLVLPLAGNLTSAGAILIPVVEVNVSNLRNSSFRNESSFTSNGHESIQSCTPSMGKIGFEVRLSEVDEYNEDGRIDTLSQA